MLRRWVCYQNIIYAHTHRHHMHSIRLLVLLALNYCTANRHNKGCDTEPKWAGEQRERETTALGSPVNAEGEPAVP